MLDLLGHEVGEYLVLSLEVHLQVADRVLLPGILRRFFLREISNPALALDALSYSFSWRTSIRIA